MAAFPGTANRGRLRSLPAVVDYTNAGGIKGSLAEVSVWLATVLAPFTVVQHYPRRARAAAASNSG